MHAPEAIAGLRDAILQRFDCDGELACDGIQTNAANLPTVTADLDRHALMGLHVDQWDFRPLTNRASSRQRVAVNVGAEPRWFLFVPRTIETIAAMLAAGAATDPTDVARELFRRNPDVAVIRVRIDPGEAYIAPTENIIHDASSFGSRKPSVTVVFRGLFRPRRVCDSDDVRTDEKPE